MFNRNGLDRKSRRLAKHFAASATIMADAMGAGDQLLNMLRESMQEVKQLHPEFDDPFYDALGQKVIDYASEMQEAGEVRVRIG